MSDLIDRNDAIMAVKMGALSAATLYGRTDEGSTALYETVRAIKAIPSAQPEKRTEERTETHACDLIDRQAAIDAISCNITVTGRQNAELVAATIGTFADRIKALPSKQPQPCKDAVSKADVLETYAELYDVFDDNKEIKNELHKIYDKINALQTAQPQRMRAKWDFIGNNMYECTSCRVPYTLGQFEAIRNYNADPLWPKFCPNCGADMRGEQDG